MSKSEMMASKLSISVIIPTFRRSAILGATLNALAEDARAWGGGTVQVIVVCDGDDQSTRSLAESYNVAGLEIHWIFHDENLGLPAARNSGAERANGDLLLFLDDDAEAAPGLLHEHASTHTRAEGEEQGFRYVACGRIVESAPVKQSSRACQFLEKSWMSTLARYDAAMLTAESNPNLADMLEICCFGLNCSIRRELFAATGGFNPVLRWMDEELEYGVRLYMQGVRFLSTSATVYHRNDKDLVTYFSRCWRLGGSCDMLRAIKLGQHDAQTRNLLKLDTGPVLEQLTNRAFWLGHSHGQTVAGWLRSLTERTGSRFAFRLWHDVERLSSYWAAVEESGIRREQLRELAGETLRVVMLHSIAEPQNDKESLYYLSPKRFRLLLEKARVDGYEYADPRRLEEVGTPKGPRELLLTFDDGYDDFYSEVYPLIAQYGLKPLVFLTAARIGDWNRWDHEKGLRRRRLLTADQIRELQRYGVRFGSHGLTHLSLPELNTTDLRREVQDSKRWLEGLLGEEVKTFAYPFGAANRRVRAAVIEAGYKMAFTVSEGLNIWQDPFAMMRIDINEQVPPWTYGLKLNYGVSPRQTLKQELIPLLRTIPRELRTPLEKAWKRYRVRKPLRG